MSESSIRPETTPDSGTTAAEEDEFVYMPEYAPDETDSSDDERSVLERISERECNITEYVMPDMPFHRRLGEFWYRNKPLILVAAAAVFLLSFIIITSLPDSYDLTSIVYVSYSDFPSTISFEMIDELTEYVEDWDENGETEVSVSSINLVDTNGIIAASNMEKLLSHLDGEPTSMLWIVDEGLYSMIIRDYGEYLFESFEGAPLWIEFTGNEVIDTCIERSECPRLGLCLRAMTDELAQNEELCLSYERALLTLSALKDARPEMFAAQ